MICVNIMANTIGKRTIQTVSVVSQNVRGIKNDFRLHELFSYILRFSILAACLQETWRTGNESLQNNNCILFLSGLEEDQQSRRGSQGVGIALSPLGVEAWKAGGCELHDDLGARVIGVRLLLKDSENRDVGVLLISAYAPDSSKSEDDWIDYLDQLDRCIQRKRAKDILVIGTDANASLGVSYDHKSPLGPFGISHINKAGRRMRTFLSTNNLVAASTRFKKPNYGTWQHPRSKLNHQIDHIITARNCFKCFTDTGITTPILDSDHRAIRCKLRLACRLRKKSDLRSKLTCLNYDKLNDPQTASKFQRRVRESIGDSKSFTELTATIQQVSQSVLPKREKPYPGWFKDNEETLLPLIETRNSAMSAVYDRRTRSSTERLRKARKALKNALVMAKNVWIQRQCSTINIAAQNNRGTSEAWKAVGKLRTGLSKISPSNVKPMRKTDGTLCSTPEENAEVFRSHFEKLYARRPAYDPTVLDDLPQHPVVNDCDHLPTDNEIRKAVQLLKNTGPGESGINAQIWKCLLDSAETYPLIKHFVTHFWINESPPSEWELGVLKILPKKGDLSDPGNHRGIMLLEVAYKIIAIIILARIKPIEEGLDHESQCGFRPGRGCTDAVFTLKQAIRKRREHGLSTWVFFMDLVKAFDRVPRELLWEILLKFGVPPKIVSLLKCLHARVVVKFSVDGIIHTLLSIIGVKQGDILGPILFLFFIAAVMITWKKVYGRSLCIFRSKADFVMTGRSYRARGEEFALADSEYADDTATLFEDRTETDVGVPHVMKHFDRFGMEVHRGDRRIENKKSKSEVLFCPKPLHMYDNPDTFDGTDLSDISLGEHCYIPIVDESCYLGSIVSSDCTDEADVDNRIEKAGAAFGALRKPLFSSTSVTYKAKRMVYVGLILAILLYGAEAWCLTEKLYNRLRVFHARCIRAMCRVTRKHTFDHRISNAQLRGRTGILSIDTYITRHQLRWAGHVARMPFKRLPRKMLSSWVRSRRPCGAPQLTYGRMLRKALKKVGIQTVGWERIATNRERWRELYMNYSD